MRNSLSSQQESQFEHVSVSELMEKDVEYGHPDTKVDILASQMLEGFGGVPIVDEQKRLIGIVTESNLLSTIGKGKRWNELSAKEIMTEDPASVTPTTEMRTLIGIMQSSHFIRMPVVNAEGKLIGIITRRDIVRGYLNTVV